MLDVFLCFSPAEREVAAAIAARLERCAEAKVWLEECETVAAAWEGGLASAAILLLLSPDAVPQRLTREAWQAVLKHVEGHASPPVGSVLVRDCPYPRLLERKHFFRWAEDARAVLRALAYWVIGLHPESEHPSFVPARLERFQGREAELEELWDKLVDRPGTVILTGSGNTGLAQEFARAAGGHFRDVLWVDCGDRSPAFIAGDLEAQLSAPIDVLERHRLLLVLDDVAGEAPISAPPEGLASVLIATRCAGGSPGPRPPMDSEDARLWRAMTACRRKAFPLALAAEIAGLGTDESRSACARLVAQGWVDPLDAAGTRFRLSGGPADATLCRKHAEVLQATFSQWRKRPEPCRAHIAELENGLGWALSNDWTLATGLADSAFAFLKAEGRLLEAARVYELLRQAAWEREDSEVVENCCWELSWIRDEPGQLRRRPPAGQQLALDFLV